MVKKKLSVTDTNNELIETEAVENKDDTAKNIKDDVNLEELSPGQGLEENPSESEVGTKTASDKSIHEEKVLQEKLAEIQDRYLRLSAEFDNYRKRTLKEKIEITKYAGEELLKDMLPLMDDFERALKHMETSGNCEGIKEGIDLIYNKLFDFLKRNGVKEIESFNIDFNVDLHDAAAKISVPDSERKGKIVEVLLKGYYLKDKVLRHSKVVIGE